jgi:hypothetical protein
VWSAVADDRETLIPALKDVIVSVDSAEKRIVVREVPGLTVPEVSRRANDGGTEPERSV